MNPLVAGPLASWCVAILPVWPPSDLFARESGRSRMSGTHSSGHHACHSASFCEHAVHIARSKS